MSREQDRRRHPISSKSSHNHDYLVKLRGIPHSTTQDDIRKFLNPCRIVNIHLFNDYHSSSGECLVDLKSQNDVEDALRKTNRFIGNRHIEVFRATVYEYNFFVKNKGAIVWREPVIRMNGLPYTCTMADVQNFFKARNGIYITRDMTDNALGGGYVAFVSMDNAYKAIDIYNQKHIQHRYIELCPSTYSEAKKTITNDAYLNGKRFSGENEDEGNKNNNHRRTNRSRNRRQSRSTSPRRYRRPVKRRRSLSVLSHSKSNRSRDKYSRRTRSRSPRRRSSSAPIRDGEYLIKMRGMPFTVVEDDIRRFFPSSCQPVHVQILLDRCTKRPIGDGYAYFRTMKEVTEAMKCDRNYIGNRYIELYCDALHFPSSNSRCSASDASSDHSSRSRSQTRNNDNSRSRSESENKI